MPLVFLRRGGISLAFGLSWCLLLIPDGCIARLSVPGGYKQLNPPCFPDKSWHAHMRAHPHMQPHTNDATNAGNASEPRGDPLATPAPGDCRLQLSTEADTMVRSLCLGTLRNQSERYIWWRG